MAGGSQSRKWIPNWALAVGAALVVFAAYTAWQMQRANREMASLQQLAAQELRRSEALTSERQPYLGGLRIVAAQETTKFALASKNPGWPTITAYWNRKMGLVLAAEKLPAVAEGRTMQLWLLPRGARPASLAIFRPDEDGRLFVVIALKQVTNPADELIITEEPAGGSQRPTSASEWMAVIR